MGGRSIDSNHKGLVLVVSLKDGKFGQLSIRTQIAPDIFECDCSCGNSIVIWRSLLVSRVQRDCEMCRRFTRAGRFRSRVSVHGHVRNFLTREGKRRRFASGEFHTWANMIARCYRKTHHAYDDYGGRGIRVCARWRERGGYGLRNFLRDLGPRPVGMTLEPHQSSRAPRTDELSMGYAGDSGWESAPFHMAGLYSSACRENSSDGGAG